MKKPDHKNRFFGWMRKKGEGLCFRKAEQPEATQSFSNPARGFYQIHTFCVDCEPDLEAQRWCLHPEDALALVLIDIGSFRDRPLDDTALARIRRILDFFVRNRYDMILRVVYDHEGHGLEREPSLFSLVLTHLQQIGPLLAIYASSIFVFQGMLVGSWGEMHTSRFLSRDHLVRMLDVLKTYQGEETYLAVRRPAYWRMLHAPGSCGTDHMGLYDDGMFGSVNHMGTFGTARRQQSTWDSTWSRADELAFMQEVGEQAPNGGEIVYGDGQTQTPEQVLSDLRRMQITYLNRVHDIKALEHWKQWHVPGYGPWAGKSVFDYVAAHLGYRFLIRSVAVTPGGQDAGLSLVELEVENTGFGSFYQEGKLYLEYQDRAGQFYTRAFPCQMKGWKSGERRRLAVRVDAGAGPLYITGKRTRDSAVIRLAHPFDEAGRTMLGELWK